MSNEQEATKINSYKIKKFNEIKQNFESKKS